MIHDASGIDVWLETQGEHGTLRIVPYVRSATALDLKYSLLLTRQGASGSSRITQSGEVHTVADQPKSLSQLGLGVQQQGDRCSVEITLSQGGKALGSYSFDCPNPKPR